MTDKIQENASGKGAVQKFFKKQGGMEYLDALMDNLKTFDNVAEYLSIHHDFECNGTSLRRYAKMNGGKVDSPGGDHCSAEYKEKMRT